MIVVIFFRWLYGYFDFTLSGKFPERFLNLSARRGITLWKSDGTKDHLTACARISDKTAVNELANKTGCTLIINKEHGFPAFCRKYKFRWGLLAGAVIGTAFCVYMSGFIWNITVNVPAGINEYEIRKELAENGLYEGVPYRYEHISTAERHMKLYDNRISWISINVFGTNAVVEISNKEDNQKRDPQKQKNQELQKKVSNLKSTADGTITRIEVQNGSAVVKVGDGVRKGQLLVSGIMEYSDGSNNFADSSGKIFARITKKITFTIPEKMKIPSPVTDKSVTKKEMNIFGIRVPLTIQGNPQIPFYQMQKNSRLTLLGSNLPIQIKEETNIPYQISRVIISRSQAEKILNKRLELYEAFLSADPDTNIIKVSTSVEKKNGSYILSAELAAEENICEKSYIQVNVDD